MHVKEASSNGEQALSLIRCSNKKHPERENLFPGALIS